MSSLFFFCRLLIAFEIENLFGRCRKRKKKGGGSEREREIITNQIKVTFQPKMIAVI